MEAIYHPGSEGATTVGDLGPKSDTDYTLKVGLAVDKSDLDAAVGTLQSYTPFCMPPKVDVALQVLRVINFEYATGSTGVLYEAAHKVLLDYLNAADS